MTTVLQIVNGAAEELGVKEAESALEAADFQSILNRLNDLGTEWADIGLTPAFKEVFNSTDLVDIDRNAVSAFKLNLALRIAPSFERIITQALATNALTTLQTLQASSIFIGKVAFPDTLPIGSGNECSEDIFDRRFFEENRKENF